MRHNFINGIYLKAMKSSKLVLLPLLLVCSISLNAAEIILNNGDIVHGDVVEQTDNSIVLQHPILGRLVIANSQIKPTELAPVDTGLFNTGFLSDWKRSAEFGIKGSEGNTRNMNIHAGVRLQVEDEVKRWDIDAAYDSSEDAGEQSQNQFFARFNRDFLNASSTRFYFTEGRYDWDEFEDWDYRLSMGGGVGDQLIKTEDWRVLGRLGIGVSKEFGGEDAEWVPEGVLGIDSVWHIAERHSLEIKNTLYPSFKDVGEFRNISELNWLIGLDSLKGIDLKLGLKNEFDSQSSGDSRNNDFKYYLALVMGL
ncbi:MAG: hypothetical protein COB62_04040 [Piscirickettsiaceae bacterium]|nr:MAG: hypothetical protein COB62_04040 [Piscirickettsiaceae bacterium]